MAKQTISHRLLVAGVILAVVTALMPPTAARAAPASWTVDSLGDAAVGVPANCTDLVAGNCRLRDALEAASSEDQIYFSVTGTLMLTGGPLEITGKNLTIEGPGMTLTIDGNSASRIFEIYSSHVSIHTMRLVNGLVNNANSGPLSIGGGGMLIAAGSDVTLGGLVLDHNTVSCDPCTTNNGLNGHGGAIMVMSNSRLSISTSTLSNNSAAWFGGGIAFNPGTNAGNSLSMTNVALTGNQVGTAPNDGKGGGLYIGFADTVTLQRLKISANTAGYAGGGLFAYDAAVSVDDSTFELNSAQGVGTQSGGGAIWSGQYASLGLTDSTFDGNTTAGEGGGGLRILQSSVVVGNSTFHSNSSTGTTDGTGGGGIFSSGTSASLTLMNVTFSGNRASSTDGGALFRSSGVLSAKNTIFADSLSSSDCYDALGTPWTSSANNLIEVNDTTGDCPTTGEWDGLDPKLGPLQDNGGPTKTMALLPGSPAIDVGNTPDCLAAPINNLDQRGETRGGDGNGDGIALCDLGALEQITNALVTIGGSLEGYYYIPMGGRVTPQYNRLDGPVEMSGSQLLFASERVHNATGFINEVMGLPDGQLHTEYWFPWYDNLSMQTWILIGNPTALPAHVHIYIAGEDMPLEVSTIPSGEMITPTFGRLNGPVHIVSTSNIFVSERVHTAQGFVQETMGFSAKQLTNEYWFPWYDNLSMQTWLLVGNPSETDTAHVHIYIAGEDMEPLGYDIAPGGKITPTYARLNGPVHIVSDNNVFASERVHNASSFVQETMGYPNNQLVMEYWFPWYDNLTMQTWLLVGNPSAIETAHVHIYIAGVDRGSQDIGPGGRWTPTFTVLNGPVHIVSDKNVFASERVHTGQGFVQETMGLPNNQLASKFWFPWYDNLTMQSWILVGRP